MKVEYLQKIFEKFSNIKFYENPSSKSRVVPCGQTDMKLVVVFCNFAKVPKKEPFLLTSALERLGGISAYPLYGHLDSGIFRGSYIACALSFTILITWMQKEIHN